jgi:hypothetical protein
MRVFSFTQPHEMWFSTVVFGDGATAEDSIPRTTPRFEARRWAFVGSPCRHAIMGQPVTLQRFRVFSVSTADTPCVQQFIGAIPARSTNSTWATSTTLTTVLCFNGNRMGRATIPKSRAVCPNVSHLSCPREERQEPQDISNRQLQEPARQLSESRWM